MLVFKVIGLLFPFIKEMILGEKTVKEAIKTNKLRVLLIGAICLSILLNFLTIPRLVQISARHVALQKKYDLATREYKEPAAPTPPLADSQLPKPDPTIADPYKRTKDFFEQIRDQEATNKK